MDVLEQFCDDYLAKSPVIGAVPFAGAVSRVEDVTCILMYRRDQFQVQMFACPEGTIIPEHAHPNVDSFEVYVGGNIQLSLDGKHVYSPSILFENKGPLKLASRRGERVRVRPGQIHGATIGDGGGGVPVGPAVAQRGSAALCRRRLRRRRDGRAPFGAGKVWQSDDQSSAKREGRRVA